MRSPSIAGRNRSSRCARRWGRCRSAPLLATQFRKSIPGAPDGEYAIVVFRTTFAKKLDARETLTLEHEPDGAWRVIGYFDSLT